MISTIPNDIRTLQSYARLMDLLSQSLPAVDDLQQRCDDLRYRIANLPKSKPEKERELRNIGVALHSLRNEQAAATQSVQAISRAVHRIQERLPVLEGVLETTERTLNVIENRHYSSTTSCARKVFHYFSNTTATLYGQTCDSLARAFCCRSRRAHQA